MKKAGCKTMYIKYFAALDGLVLCALKYHWSLHRAMKIEVSYIKLTPVLTNLSYFQYNNITSFCFYFIVILGYSNIPMSYLWTYALSQ